jgi:ankyrin repeat protein
MGVSYNKEFFETFNLEEFLIKYKDINKTDNDHNSLLNKACYYGYVEIAKILLENGISTTTFNYEELKYGGTYKNAIKIVKLLLKYNVNVNNNLQLKTRLKKRQKKKLIRMIKHKLKFKINNLYIMI